MPTLPDYRPDTTNTGNHQIVHQATDRHGNPHIEDIRELEACLVSIHEECSVDEFWYGCQYGLKLAIDKLRQKFPHILKKEAS